MTRVYKISYIFITMLLLVFVSCSDEDIYTENFNNDIRFGVTFNDYVGKSSRSTTKKPTDTETLTAVSQTSGDTLYIYTSTSDYDTSSESWVSRSNIVNSIDDMYNSFYVSAYHYQDNWSADKATTSPNYFTEESAVLSGSTYKLASQRFWPTDGKMRFVAYSHGNDNAFTFDAGGSGKGPAMHINVDPSVDSQSDLLVSFGSEINCDGHQNTVPLNFKHALTSVKFCTDKTMIRCVIKSITIKNVYYQGTYLYNLTDASQSSTADLTLDDNFSHNELKDRSFTVNVDYKLKGSSEEQLTDGEMTLLMLPQTLPDDAAIEIEIQKLDSNGNPIDGDFDTITGSIGGRTWPAGKIVNYKLSNTDQILEVSEGATFNYLGKTYDSDKDVFNTGYDVTVSSHNSAGNIRWNVSYMDENSETWQPTSSWLSIDPSWTWSDEPSQTVPFRAISEYTSIDIDKNLKAASPKGTSSAPYNLSNGTGSQTVENTANCYIVDAPGYYILPLVYGNAYEDGQTNSQAYQYSASGDSILLVFRNHLDKDITAPYIADNDNCVPASASLVWQDENNLVTDISYDGTAFNKKGGIRFHVDANNIRQGNAVIAIKNADDTVMWSWHIWVTRFDFEKDLELVNQDGQHINVMPVNLGWCTNSDNNEMVRYYPKRTCKVKFTPSEGDEALSKTITFVQESHMSFPLGNNPYYQWGRKDPFVGTNIAWGNKHRWDGDGKFYDIYSQYNPERLFSDVVEAQERLTTVEALGLMIQNPDKWHNPPAVEGGTSYISKNKIYKNLWGDISFGAAKTVYDPCPSGYKVNYYYTYTGFLPKNYNWNDPSKINFVRDIASDWDGEYLAEFYTDETKMHSIIFPICGYRDWNSDASVIMFKTEGYCWERGCFEGSYTYMFKFGPNNNTNDVAPVSSFFATDGMPVRPEACN